MRDILKAFPASVREIFPRKNNKDLIAFLTLAAVTLLILGIALKKPYIMLSSGTVALLEYKIIRRLSKKVTTPAFTPK